MRFLSLILLCCSTAPAFSALPFDPELARLSHALEISRSQSDLNVASGHLADYWDRRLLAVEQQIVAQLNPADRKKFTKVQAEWRRFRSSEVAFGASFFAGGSIQPLMANSRYALLTEHRVTELAALIIDAPSN